MLLLMHRQTLIRIKRVKSIKRYEPSTVLTLYDNSYFIHKLTLSKFFKQMLHYTTTFNSNVEKLL